MSQFARILAVHTSTTSSSSSGGGGAGAANNSTLGSPSSSSSAAATANVTLGNINMNHALEGKKSRIADLQRLEDDFAAMKQLPVILNFSRLTFDLKVQCQFIHIYLCLVLALWGLYVL
jgi:hypothetical protein